MNTGNPRRGRPNAGQGRAYPGQPGQGQGQPGRSGRVTTRRRSASSKRQKRRSRIAGRRDAMLRVGAVLGGFALLVGLAMIFPAAGDSGKAGAQSVRVPVDQATLACPESAFVRGSTTTEVAAVAAPSKLDDVAAGEVGPGKNTGGELTIGDLAGGKPVAKANRREQQATTTVRKGGQQPLVAEGTKGLAPGATAGQITRTTSGPSRGLSEAACTNPGSEFWFVGSGSAVGRHARLYLSNADDTAAQLDVLLYDEKGLIKDDATRSLEVGAHKQRVVKLDSYAPTSKRLAVQVKASRGRVVAAMRDDMVDGSTGQPLGIDWIPQASAPGTQLVVPGLAPGSGARVVTIVAPGDTSAVVDLGVMGKNNTFTPARLGRLEVPAGTVQQVSLDTATSRIASGLRISSDVPVTASVRSELGAKAGPRDFVHTAAVAPLTGPAVVPTTLSGSKIKSSLLLSALGRTTVDAQITLLAPDGRQQPPIKVTVPAGGTLETKLPGIKGASRYTVVVTPEEPGKLVGTRLQVESAEDGPLVSSWQLSTARTTTVRPVASPDPGVPLR